jgi:hypothetical protein
MRPDGQESDPGGTLPAPLASLLPITLDSPPTRPTGLLLAVLSAANRLTTGYSSD